MSSKELGVLFSSAQERPGLPPVRAKVENAWIYWWVGANELLLRANETGHVLRYVSGPKDDPSSYQELFVVPEGTKVMAAFSRTQRPLRRADVEPQLSYFEVKADLSASLARLGPVFVPPDGRKTIRAMPLTHIRAGEAIEPLHGDEISLIASYREPWGSGFAGERRAVENRTWHPGSRAFRDVANTPNRGAKRTTVLDVDSAEQAMDAIRGRPIDSIRRLNIFTHAYPGLISLSGYFEGEETYLNQAKDNDRGQPIGGGIDGSVTDWLNSDDEGRQKRDDVRSRFTKHGEILLFLCNGGLGTGMSLAMDIARCFNVRVLAYSDAIGYYIDFASGRVDRNLTSRGLVSDAAYDGARASGKIAPGYPFVVEAPEDVPDGSHLRPDRPIGKPKRPAS